MNKEEREKKCENHVLGCRQPGVNVILSQKKVQEKTVCSVNDGEEGHTVKK